MHTNSICQKMIGDPRLLSSGPYASPFEQKFPTGTVTFVCDRQCTNLVFMKLTTTKFDGWRSVTSTYIGWTDYSLHVPCLPFDIRWWQIVARRWFQIIKFFVILLNLNQGTWEWQGTGNMMWYQTQLGLRSAQTPKTTLSNHFVFWNWVQEGGLWRHQCPHKWGSKACHKDLPCLESTVLCQAKLVSHFITHFKPKTPQNPRIST